MAYPYTSYQNPYQQNYYPYQQMQQPIIQQAQPMQTQQTPIPQPGIIWVSGERDAQMYPVAPNNAVTLWNQNEAVVYLKQADATGKPTLKIYDLVERTQSVPTVSDGKGTTTPYATKDELSAVVGVVKGFDELIGGIKADIDAMKSDMYGIAGKKKTVTRKPKVEEMEDDE